MHCVTNPPPCDDLPLLYARREYLEQLDASAADTTSCQTTSNPDDYGPDD